MISVPAQTTFDEIRSLIESCPFTTWEFEGAGGERSSVNQPEGIFSILSGNFGQVAILALPVEANLRAVLCWPKGVLTFHPVFGKECVKVRFHLTEVVGLARDNLQPGKWSTPLAQADCLLLLGRVETLEISHEEGGISMIEPVGCGHGHGFLSPPSKETIALN